MRTRTTLLAALALGAAGAGLWALARDCQAGDRQDKGKAEAPRPRPRPPAKAADPDPPPEDQLFVWPMPEKGVQTVLVLRAADGESFEAALLVPLPIKLKGVRAPDPASKEGKAAVEELQKLIAGRLLPSVMSGRDEKGRVIADLWMGKPDPKQPGASGWLSRHLLSRKLVSPE